MRQKHTVRTRVRSRSKSLGCTNLIQRLCDTIPKRMEPRPIVLIFHASQTEWTNSATFLSPEFIPLQVAEFGWDFASVGIEIINDKNPSRRNAITGEA